MNKKVLIPIVILVCLAAIGCVLGYLLKTNVFASDQLPLNATINGIECGGLSIDEAEEKLIEEWNSRSFFFKNDSGSVLGKVNDLDFTYDIGEKLSNIKKDNFFAAVFNYYFNSAFDVNMEMTVDKVNKEFKKELKHADYLKEEDIVQTEDAYVDLSTGDFKIVPEVYGNNIDYDALTKEITSQIAVDIFEMEYDPSDFYQKPEITADSEEIKERQEFCKKYLTSKVTYLLGSEEVKIPPETLEKIFDIEIVESGDVQEDEEETAKKSITKVSVDEEEVRKFVESFAQEYDTLGMTRNFTSLSGKNINVSGGDYGFAVDQEEETKQLVKDLKSGEVIKREPKWLMTGFTTYSRENDVGDTYVDISLSEQHLWYFKDGKKVIDTPVVTGNYQSHDTPTGTFGLSYKQRGATLKGNNSDGSTYESPVSYWMPFYGNYGMHDAPWRSSFGGSIYRGNGSHGCVNMPIPAAKTVFENLADKNVPVIVHW